jgi:L-threonylcarbamoyladenylate synthase
MMASTRTTKRYRVDDLEEAALALRAGATIAFPTETVYGLGAHAFNPEAIAHVFEAKGRPQDNPLIVHVSDETMLQRCVSRVPSIAQSLMATYWPGPLTLLLPKSDLLPPSVTAGLATVAVRIPSDPVALELIRRADVPIVAPSANLSGRPSATTWEAVIEDLDGRIDGVVCGRATRVGLESTVLDTLHDPPRILRHGAISLHALQATLPAIVDASQGTEGGNGTASPSPGMKHRHYQPNARVEISHASEPIRAAGHADGYRRGWIGIHAPPSSMDYATVVVCANADDYAARLFETFRRMDQAGIDVIDCEAVSRHGIGAAIMDRLERASLRS